MGSAPITRHPDQQNQKHRFGGVFFVKIERACSLSYFVSSTIFPSGSRKELS
jgi:hypothetical protein